jgi:hypothetical protein
VNSRNVAGVVTALVLALAGCGNGAVSADRSAPAPAQVAPPAAGLPAPPAATAAPVDRPAVAEASVPVAADLGTGNLTYSVLELGVEGRLTRLVLRLRTDGGADADATVNQLVGSKTKARALAPELIDPQNLKAYEAADGGVSILDGIGVTVGTSGSEFTFYYAAPQDAVTAFDVALGSGLPTLRGVPLTR